MKGPLLIALALCVLTQHCAQQPEAKILVEDVEHVGVFVALLVPDVKYLPPCLLLEHQRQIRLEFYGNVQQLGIQVPVNVKLLIWVTFKKLLMKIPKCLLYFCAVLRIRLHLFFLAKVLARANALHNFMPG